MPVPTFSTRELESLAAPLPAVLQGATRPSVFRRRRRPLSVADVNIMSLRIALGQWNDFAAQWGGRPHLFAQSVTHAPIALLLFGAFMEVIGVGDLLPEADKKYVRYQATMSADLIRLAVPVPAEWEAEEEDK